MIYARLTYHSAYNIYTVDVSLDILNIMGLPGTVGALGSLSSRISGDLMVCNTTETIVRMSPLIKGVEFDAGVSLPDSTFLSVLSPASNVLSSSERLVMVDFFLFPLML